MEAKSVLYAAVGAPVVAARKVGKIADDYRNKLSTQTSDYGKSLEETMGEWASEGEKVIGRLGDQKVVEDLTSRVDLDQAKDQVSKLRDQLEEMLSTWRTSFRPEGEMEAEKTPAEPVAKTSAAKKPADKSTTTKKPAAKKPAAKSTTAKKPAAKKPAAKSTTTKKPAAKKAAAKSATAKKPAAKK